MNFHIDTFHFFNKKLLDELNSYSSFDNTSLDIDWKEVVTQRKKIYNENKFIVVIDNQIVLNECLPESNIRIHNDNAEYIIELLFSHIQSEHIYLIEFQKNKQNLKLSFETPVNFIHEVIVCQHCTSRIDITQKVEMDYYHLSTCYDDYLHYQKIYINSHAKSNFYILAGQQKDRAKFDYLFNLYEQAQLNLFALTHLAQKQLRDDAIEIVHCSSDTHSLVSYLSLNSGKSVSQVNSVVMKNASQCEVKQNIKHIILNEDAHSYSRPNLMIDNPLVVASHGNNIGGINPDNLFYLMQRGISQIDAKYIISNSYIFDFCNTTKFPEQFKSYFFNKRKT